MEKERQGITPLIHQSDHPGNLRPRVKGRRSPGLGLRSAVQEAENKGREQNHSLHIQLLGVRCETDVLPIYRQTPVADLLYMHNLGYPIHTDSEPSLVIVTCMDYRIHLRLPDKFAFILRTAGANLHQREFDLSCAVALADLKHVCIIGHTQCAMVNLPAKREAFITGLARAGGWDPAEAGAYFESQLAHFQLADASQFVCQQARRLHAWYPGVLIAPFLFRLEDGLLYQVVEGNLESRHQRLGSQA